MDEILRALLSDDKSLLERRDEMIAKLDEKVPNNLRRDYAAIKKALLLNIGEIFASNTVDYNTTKTKALNILLSSGMQEVRAKFVVDTFTKVLWDKPHHKITTIKKTSIKNQTIKTNKKVDKTVDIEIPVKTNNLVTYYDTIKTIDFIDAPSRADKKSKSKIWRIALALIIVYCVATFVYEKSTIAEQESEIEPDIILEDNLNTIKNPEPNEMTNDNIEEATSIEKPKMMVQLNDQKGVEQTIISYNSTIQGLYEIAEQENAVSDVNALKSMFIKECKIGEKGNGYVYHYAVLNSDDYICFQSNLEGYISVAYIWIREEHADIMKPVLDSVLKALMVMNFDETISNSALDNIILNKSEVDIKNSDIGRDFKISINKKENKYQYIIRAFK